jgi:5-methylcytosine-specific restriction endonuclease McrA
VNILDHDRYHFNLYGYNERGEEIMLTKDHIIPKSKEGKNDIDNYQTMCCKCNWKKGNNDE